MTWAMVAVGVGTAVVGAASSASAAKKGAKAQTNAANMTIAEQRRQHDLARQDQAPWMQHGQRALGGLDALNSGDYSGFMNSPDYLYARDQGLEGVNRHLAAKGGYYSGGGDADRMKFLSGLATQNLGNYRGALQSSAGMGQSTAAGLGRLGADMAGNIGNAYGNIGNARASSYAQQSNAWNNAGQQMVGAFGQGYGQNNARNGGNGGWYVGNNPGRG